MPKSSLSLANTIMEIKHEGNVVGAYLREKSVRESGARVERGMWSRGMVNAVVERDHKRESGGM